MSATCCSWSRTPDVGTTWHAAGLITQARPTSGTREIVKRSLDIYRNLESDTGLSTGYMPTGTLHLALSEARRQELLRQASTSRGNGIRVEMLTPEQTIAHFPLLSPEGLVCSLYYPDEGRATATDITMSLAKGARLGGARIIEGVTVTDIATEAGRAVGVRTSVGEVEADYVVNCTGMWARQIGAQAGVQHPLQALAHYYVVTDKIDGLPTGMPTIKSGDDWSYVKDDAGSLMVGFFEPGSYPWASKGIPENDGFIHLPEDWDHIGPFYERMIERIPALAEAGIRLFFGGPESFTPDGLYHLGEVPGLQSYLVAAGFNSVGMLSGPGAGSVLADWLVDGRPSIDLPECDPRRTMPHETNRRFLEQRVTETLDLAYSVHWPFEQRRSARPLRRSILHPCTSEAGAVFGELLGWERPNWYALPGDDRRDALTWGRPSWFARSAEEHEAVRERRNARPVQLRQVPGPGAGRGRRAATPLRQRRRRRAGADRLHPVAQRPGRHRGRPHRHPRPRTSTSCSPPPASTHRDLDWLARRSPARAATAADVSGTMAMLAVMGPEARRPLQPLTDADLSHDRLPLRHLTRDRHRARRSPAPPASPTWASSAGSSRARRHRRHVWDTLREAGTSVGLRPSATTPSTLCDGEGLPQLGPRHLRRRHPAGGRTRLRSRMGQARRFHRPGGTAGPEADGCAAEDWCSSRSTTRAHAAPRRAYLPRRVAWSAVVTSTAHGHTLGRAVALGYVQASEPGLPRAWYERVTTRSSSHPTVQRAGEPAADVRPEVGAPQLTAGGRVMSAGAPATASSRSGGEPPASR